jgi:hypothetical protein
MSRVYRIRLVAIKSLAWWKARPWLRNEVLRSCGNVIATFSYPSFRMIPTTFTNGVNKFKFIGRHKIYPVDRSSRVFETLQDPSTRAGGGGLFGS